MEGTSKDQVHDLADEFNLVPYDQNFDWKINFEKVLMEYHNDVDLHDLSLDSIFSWLNESTKSPTSGTKSLTIGHQNNSKSYVSIDKISLSNYHELGQTPIKTATSNHPTIDKRRKSIFNSQNDGMTMLRSCGNSLETIDPYSYSEKSWTNSSVVSSAVTRPELYNKITSTQVSGSSTKKPLVQVPYAAASYPSMGITEQSLEHQSNSFTNFLSGGSVEHFPLNKSKCQPTLKNYPVSTPTPTLEGLESEQRYNIHLVDTPPPFSRSSTQTGIQRQRTGVSLQNSINKSQLKKPIRNRITHAPKKKHHQQMFVNHSTVGQRFNQSRNIPNYCYCNYHYTMDTSQQSVQHKCQFNTNSWNCETPFNKNRNQRPTDFHQYSNQNGFNLCTRCPPLIPNTNFQMDSHESRHISRERRDSVNHFLAHPYTEFWLGEPVEY